jgi:hypothetical protein
MTRKYAFNPLKIRFHLNTKLPTNATDKSEKTIGKKEIRQNVACPGAVLDLFPNRCEQPDIHRGDGRARTTLPSFRTPRWMMPSRQESQSPAQLHGYVDAASCAPIPRRRPAVSSCYAV